MWNLRGALWYATCIGLMVFSPFALAQQCHWWGTLYPLCRSTQTGWGWEDNQSCISERTCATQPPPYGYASSVGGFSGKPYTRRSTLQRLSARFPQLAFAVVEFNPRWRRLADILRELPGEQGLATFFWELTESGFWGDPIFNASAAFNPA